MNDDFLYYYNQELAYIHEKGKEFAEEYPKIAGRLGMNGIEVADPYVERLMEGFSFLTARIRMKMDAEFPKFSQQIIERIYPNYLSPIPAMSIAQFSPDLSSGNLKQGIVLPKGIKLRSQILAQEKMACDFTTGDEISLLPLKITSIKMENDPLEFSLKNIGINNQEVNSYLRIGFEVTNNVDIDKFISDKLTFFLNGQDVHMFKLLELIMSHSIAAIIHDTARPTAWLKKINKEDIVHEGFKNTQSLLPVDDRMFQGYRILQEYFAFPEKFLFFSINNLLPIYKSIAQQQKTLKKSDDDKITGFEITILFDTLDNELINNITENNILLNCVPIINLFSKSADRVKVTPNKHEYHVVVDRTKPINYEVYSISKVEGYYLDSLTVGKEFRPLYQSYTDDTDNYGAYYAVNRESRTISTNVLDKGFRTEYIGCETFISLVDQHNKPFAEELKILGVDVLCSNRDLPRLLPVGNDNDLILGMSAPVKGIKILKRPSKPKFPLADGANIWKVINQLGINYQSLMGMDETQGAVILREMLSIYTENNEFSNIKQLKGIKTVKIEPSYCRVPMPGPILYGRAVQIHITFDDKAFAGISPYLFGSVLAQFFSKHVSINTMTETIISTVQKGVIGRWQPIYGSRAVI